MAKGTSFLDKVKKGAEKEKQFSMVKYVKSVVSEKTGQYRFQEIMLKIPTGMKLDGYLKTLDEEPSVSDEVEASEEKEKNIEVDKKVDEEPVLDESTVDVEASELPTEEEVVSTVQVEGKSKNSK